MNTEDMNQTKQNDALSRELTIADGLARLGCLELRQGDCMAIMRECPDNYFDLAICDPPYFKGVAKKGFFGGEVSTTGVRRLRSQSQYWDGNIPSKDYFDELKRVSRHQIVWGINYYEGFAGCTGRIVWDKKNESSTFSNCELASCTLTKHVKIFRHQWNGFMKDSERGQKRIHPTQKPVALYDWLLAKYAKPGWRILDTHLGSGSSAVACLKSANPMVGCELDPDYFRAAVERIQRDSVEIFPQKAA